VKILWHSNSPKTCTGYGQQTAMFTPMIRDLGHEVAISCFYGLEGTMDSWQGMPCFPTDHTRFGNTMLPFYAGRFAGTDDPRDVLLLTLLDVWAMRDGHKNLADMRVASWTPVDHDPLPPRVAQYFALTDARPIAMSRFGEAAMTDQGLEALYVPHGVDTKVFRPLEDKAKIRRSMGIPEDAFVIGMVANNKGQAPPRKAFPQVMQAFRVFLDDHPDAILFLHSELFGFDQGLHLLNLADICGVPKDNLATSDQLSLHLGVPQSRMVEIYNGFDVLASPSYGEGFGIPIIEAQACGVPVIVTNWTSMPELCGAGWLVEGDPWYDPPHGSFYMNPAISEIVAAFESAYDARGDTGLSVKAREFAVGYDSRTVFERYWMPVLDELAGPREVGPLKLAAAG
jgi:glycosyltransferase involved in cell wall biosynthesis